MALLHTKFHSAALQVAMRTGETEGVFTIPELQGRFEAEVLDEGRVVEVFDGRFADEFGVYQVHRYRIRGAFH
jgi:hypothetical protein